MNIWRFFGYLVKHMALSNRNRRGPYNKYLETENPLANLPRRTRYRHEQRFLRAGLLSGSL